MKNESADVPNVKDVYDYLVKNKVVENFLYKERVVLDINACVLPEEVARMFRRTARLLSQRKNMPFAFWSNASGGVCCGFFIYRGQSFEELKIHLAENEFIVDDNDERIKLNSNLMKLFDFLREMDFEEKYDVYWFN